MRKENKMRDVSLPRDVSRMLRLYGPLEPWIDKTWKPGDLGLVE